MQLTFKKISGGWYVDLPDWTGAFEDLEMVNGADTLLEVLSQKLHAPIITFDVWTSKPDVPSGLLHKIEETLDGATYDVKNCLYYNDTAWLCNVTKFVFGGYHPDDIYFRVAGLDVCDSDNHSESQDEDTAIPEDIEYKKIKVTAVNIDIKKAVTITADMKQLAKCQTQDAVKKAIENQILETKIFRKEDLPKLKYQGRKDALDEWKRIRPSFVEQEGNEQNALDNTSNRTTPDNITHLGANEIFVFGSNDAGMHYGGAARYAVDHFGAVMGQGHGMQGKSYAINSMSGIAIMGEEVKTFAEYARKHSEKIFLVTPIGCGIAGYDASEIAPLFKCCRGIPNVSLPASFWDVIGVPESIEEKAPATKYDLDRFLTAQEYNYPIALEEMKKGRKVSHWIWFIFPQVKGLGHSYNSEYYGLDGVEEAKAYLKHPVLSKRLREICDTLLQHKAKAIRYIMGGSLDAMKLHSSMEIFNIASPNDIFAKVLCTFF